MALVKLGQLVCTPAAKALCDAKQIDMRQLICRHRNGDWGDLCQSDHDANADAIAFGGMRIFSSYNFGDDKIWIITEADNSSTCVLLPSDY